MKVLDLIREMINVGFSKYESMVYIALVKEGIQSAPSLAHTSGVPKSKIYDVLDRLLEKRLIEEYPGAPRKFRARSPDLVLDEMLKNSKEKLQSIETGAAGLKSTLGEFYKAKELRRIDSNSVLWTVNGRRAFHEKFAEMGDRARKEILVISPYFTREPITERSGAAASRRGVKIAGVTALSAENAARVKYFLHTHFDEIRNFRGEIPITVVIADRAECMYRMTYEVAGQTNYIGVHSANPGLVKAFVQYWQALWKTSRPITPQEIEKLLERGVSFAKEERGPELKMVSWRRDSGEEIAIEAKQS